MSIGQPHIRPIVRGKSGKAVEFGAKLSVSHLATGYVVIDKLSWDAYNESGDLPKQIESYRNRFVYYPQAFTQTPSIEICQTETTAKNVGYD